MDSCRRGREREEEEEIGEEKEEETSLPKEEWGRGAQH